MSSSIAIPSRRRKKLDNRRSSLESPAESSSMSSSTASSSGGVEVVRADGGMASPPSSSTGGNPVVGQRRRSSLLSPSLARCEHTVINIGQPDAPRLITCVKSSQGFDWNQEMFLASYVDHDFGELERKQEPVQDIILTDEEAAALLP